MGYQPKELETNCNKSVSVLEPLTDEKFSCQSALEILGRKRLIIETPEFIYQFFGK